MMEECEALNVTMPMCKCGRAFATVELKTAAGRVLVCEDCASMAEMILKLVGADAKRRPVLGLVPRGSVE